MLQLFSAFPALEETLGEQNRNQSNLRAALSGMGMDLAYKHIGRKEAEKYLVCPGEPFLITS